MTDSGKDTMNNTEPWYRRVPSPRVMVLGVLGAITVGVALLSTAVSYDILHPRFGGWASPTVGALDALWVVLLAAEAVAANDRSRRAPVQWAGLVLTVVIAAIPTADLLLAHGSSGRFDLAVILAPLAIVATKLAWHLVLPALGRRVSPTTRQAIDARRQAVADRLEQMTADAADRIELLEVATTLEERLAEAETRYRVTTLKRQQTSTQTLHEQAQTTEKTIMEQPLPALVADIELPELDAWTTTLPALPVAPSVAPGALPDSQVSEPEGDEDDDSSRLESLLVTVEEIASVTGVPVPATGQELTDEQIGVVLRALRYTTDPPMSQRKASAAYRRAGFKGGEHKLRPIWRRLRAEAGEADEVEDEETEDADGARA